MRSMQYKHVIEIRIMTQKKQDKKMWWTWDQELTNKKKSNGSSISHEALALTSLWLLWQRRCRNLRRRSRARFRLLEIRRSHRDELDRIARLHSAQRVAGVNWTHERVGGFDGNLCEPMFDHDHD